jgi:hypothetical protein
MNKLADSLCPLCGKDYVNTEGHKCNLTPQNPEKGLEVLAHSIATEIIADLKDRRGIGNQLEECALEVRAEIKSKMIGFIVAALRTLARERDQEIANFSLAKDESIKARDERIVQLQAQLAERDRELAFYKGPRDVTEEPVYKELKKYAAKMTAVVQAAGMALNGGNLNGVSDVHYCSKCGISVNGKLVKKAIDALSDLGSGM